MDTIQPISKELLKKELNEKHFIRKTRKGSNEIYSLNYHTAPNVLKEIGRLREITFRASGGGTGKELDLDHYDTDEVCYEQLIVWSPQDEEIIGGYRYIKCKNAIQNPSKIGLSTTHYFNFSDQFISEYLPYTIELGRSWVRPDYQPSVNPRKGLFALDNIWDGLGALIIFNPDINYFFGKVTMYQNYNTDARNFLLTFINHFFPDQQELLLPHSPLDYSADQDHYLSQIDKLTFSEAFKILNSFVREKKEFIPPLINIYMNLSPSMKTFGTALNSDFGNVEETAILVRIDDIFEDKKERHLIF
ncbi:MAG: GNAT family N-acetyltransferase [Crocinitomicaceae bacterium]|tara:strand:+ start:1634 stop:2545 length:912 start_codon:yes stop_codon:yes gene_type:complete